MIATDFGTYLERYVSGLELGDWFVENGWIEGGNFFPSGWTMRS